MEDDHSQVIQELKTAIQYNDSEALRDTLSCYPEAIGGLAIDGVPLLHYICKQPGSCVDILKVVLEARGVDVNQTSDEGTPLQVACRYGADQLVHVLLDAGAWLETDEVPVYDSNSPFYLASAYGHYGVIEKLFVYQPSMCNTSAPLELVKEMRVRTCLLYAACLGGNQRIIKMWLTPEMDINHPPYYSSTSSFSMDKTPLYAACAGNHLEVAEMLVGFGAEVNQRIVEDFPEISSKLVKNCISEQQMEYTLEAGYSEELVHIANYSHKELGGFHDFWISDYKNILVELNISNNHISRLPANIPWDLPSLKTFNASCNKISAIRVDPQCTILCKRLENILLQENQLEELCYELFQLPELRYLNVAHNKMRYMVKSHQRYEDWRVLKPDTDKPEWSCTKLRCLNASYNNLEMLPTEISSCSGLVELDASNNKLVAFPSPWECKLSTLNLSHNVMVRFAPSVELFWCATLKKLHLDYNQLEEMTESMVKLCCLQVLNLSNNKINVLQRPEVWDCKMLQILDLSGNRLGIPSGDTPLPTTKSKLLPRRRSRLSSCSENVSSRIALPSFLAHCLNELNLSDNCLDCVPPSVCQLVSLQTLDISNNPAIKSLPKELGRLSQCNSLNIQGTGIPGGEVSPSAVDCHIWTKKYIQGLNEKLRQSKGYYRLKLVVVGKKDKGKTAITNLLGCKSNFEIHGSGIRRVETTLCPKKKSGILDKLHSSNKHRIRNEKDQSKRLPIELCVWDLAGDECYKATHHCFFTPNSLYLVVWDLWSLAKDMEKIGKLLYSIEARNPHSKVIIAATFLDKNNSPTRDEQVSEIKGKLLEAFGSASERYGGLCSQLEDYNIIPMSCTTGAGISELRDALYNTACNMKELGNKSLGTRYLLGRSIPNSYLLIEKEIYRELENRIRDGKPPFLVQRELYELIENIPGCDVEVPQEVPEVVKFLVTSGAMLHFNEQLQGLNNFFYLDPTWLCDVLSQVLIDSSLCQSMKGGKIALSTVQEMYLQDSRFPNENVPQYIQLLEQFEIALKVELDRKLFIPSHLHANPGMDLQFHGRDGKRVSRLYQLAFIPNGLWSRLLSRIMCRIELLANDWVLRSSVRIKPGKSFYRINSKASKGLKINNKDMIYWEDGMFLRHEMGHFMLESVQVSQREGYITHGILITVQSLEEDYSIMGMIVDAVEDLLSDHYPGLMDYDMVGRPRIQRFAICPVCYTITSSVLPSNLDHFTVEHCARLLLSGDTALCRRGTKVPLSQLVPELLMQELPRKFLLDSEKLQVDPSNKKAYLGSGVTGSVFKGKYGDVDIAVKYYHGAPSMSGKHSLDSSYYSGGNISSVERNKPLHNDDDDEDLDDYVNAPNMHLDMDEASSIKAFRAFMEMRQEADVTSKLDHPCVVSFVGISIRPDLLMCLELAPLGSLRRVLDNEIEGREPFNKYRDKDKVFLPVFSKEINFKLVHQIVRGLDYLHKHDIIYRDLKSDNILVTSLDPEAPVNVKLSDYGISKFNTSGGTVGLVGTPGYQAPEIMEGLAYDEKVDIFSFSMVLYEILSGERPYCEYKNMAQISRAMKMEAKRPNLQDFNIDPRFPMLERLMELCWNQDATQRPSAKDILTTSHMMSADFLAQHKHFPRELEEVDFVTSVTEYGGVKRQVWVWEGNGDDRCYHILDATMCTYQAFRKPLPGATVTCMDKIGKQIWIGTEDEQIEVFGQQGVGHPSSLKKLDNLGATPTCIEYVKNEELGKKVYILLGDGQLRIYQHIKKPEVIEGEEVNLRHQFNWHLKKILRLSKRTASCLVYVMETEELWCGCGSDIVIVSNRTEMIERRIEINKECQAILENKLPDVMKLVHMDCRIWALLANSSELLEFDTEMGILTHILKCDQINPHKMVVSKYISNSSVQVQAMPISRRFSVSSDDSSCEKISSGEFDKWFDESSSSANARADSENNPPPPIPERCVSVSDPQHPALSPPLPPRRPTMAKKSQTLPARASPPSSGSPIPRNRHPIVNSVAGVGDSIWVGRSTGDILIINVKSNAQCQHGCVMAVMKNHCDKQHIIHEVEKLVTVENLIFSVIKADSKFTEITAWEAYDVATIQKLEQIWARPKSMVFLRNSNTDNVVDMGEV